MLICLGLMLSRCHSFLPLVLSSSVVYQIKNTCGFEFCLQPFVQKFTEALPQNTEYTDK